MRESEGHEVMSSDNHNAQGWLVDRVMMMMLDDCSHDILGTADSGYSVCLLCEREVREWPSQIARVRHATAGIGGK